ncbi:hypothetical protein [uncultured Roseovarius sp.]|uniref:hypothetical protein n=1 Tax=uncultured Roseovarius sp. TaxID=293344 RepID=UPI003412F810
MLDINQNQPATQTGWPVPDSRLMMPRPSLNATHGKFEINLARIVQLDPDRANGHQLSHDHSQRDPPGKRPAPRWMEVVVPAFLPGLPALCVPAGLGTSGTPMGLQLIGRRGQPLSCTSGDIVRPTSPD